MKHLRRALTLLLCLTLVCAASAASAASKTSNQTFTEVPTIKFTYVPETSLESGGMKNIDISTSLPGFLNMYLLDQSGNIVLTIVENQEIHSNVTSFDVYAVDDNGDPLEPGLYTVSADMVSQYGVPSKTVTRDTQIAENEEGAAAATTGRKTSTSGKTEMTASASSSASNSANSSNASSSSASKAAATASSKAAATPAPTDEMQYTEGTYAMGDEGLLIGVGVDDTAVQSDAGYWGLTADASDADIWAALTRTMTGVDVGENESAYIYDSPEGGRKKLGTVSGLSQGLNVVKARDDGWSLVEAFRNEDGAFVRGYMKSDKLRTVDPNPNYGIVIDKATQTLTVYKDGARLGSCLVSTGLATPKYPHRETPAGEFILVTRRGSYEYYGMGFTKYTIRINGGYYLAEVPTTKKNGTKFLEMPDALGAKATRGTVCLAHDASTDGGINAEWIWNMTDDNKKVKVLIFDDKPRTDVPVSSK